MHSILYSSLAAAMISMAYGATIAQRDIPDEIVYLTNCLGNGIAESQMNYSISRDNAPPYTIPQANNWVHREGGKATYGRN
jgi:hypothetical protein